MNYEMRKIRENGIAFFPWSLPIFAPFAYFVVGLPVRER